MEDTAQINNTNTQQTQGGIFSSVVSSMTDKINNIVQQSSTQPQVQDIPNNPPVEEVASTVDTLAETLTQTQPVQPEIPSTQPVTQVSMQDVIAGIQQPQAPSVSSLDNIMPNSDDMKPKAMVRDPKENNLATPIPSVLGDAQTLVPPTQDASQPANIEQPQPNAEQPQPNIEKPQTNIEQPQAGAEQPKEETDYSMRKPRFSCSATHHLPSSTPIAWLIMLLVSLGLLIHQRRLDK